MTIDEQPESLVRLVQVSPLWGRLQGGIVQCRTIGAAGLQRGWVVSPDYRALIAALVEQRKVAGISQRELARRLGKPPSFVNKIELLERRIDLLEFIAIAEAFGAKPDDILKKIRAFLPSPIIL